MTLEATRPQVFCQGGLSHTNDIARQLADRSFFTLPEGVTVNVSALLVKGSSRTKRDLGKFVPNPGIEYFPDVNVPINGGFVLTAGLDSPARRQTAGIVNEGLNSLHEQAATVRALQQKISEAEVDWLTKRGKREAVDTAEQEYKFAREALVLAETRHTGRSDHQVEDRRLAQAFVGANPDLEELIIRNDFKPDTVVAFSLDVPVFEPVRIKVRP